VFNIDNGKAAGRGVDNHRTNSWSIAYDYQGDYMIKSFKDSDTESVFGRIRVTKFSIELQRQTQRKLGILQNAVDLNDLRIPPGNRLEKLSGNRAGQHSIRVNDQWRICFVWEEGNAWEGELTDYH